MPSLVFVGVQSLSHAWPFATPWTAAHQAALFMRSPRQEYWSGLSFSSPGDLLDPGTEPSSSALQVDSSPLSHKGSTVLLYKYTIICLFNKHVWVVSYVWLLWIKLLFTTHFFGANVLNSSGVKYPRVELLMEKAMAPYSSTLAWKIPGMGEPGGLLSLGLHRVGHDWSDLAALNYLANRMCFVLVCLNK